MLRFRRSGSVAGSGAIEVPGVRRKECTHIGRGTLYDETDRFLAGCIHNSGRRCRLHGLRPGHINSCVPHQYSGRTTRRSPSAHCGHALARARDRRRRLARRAACDAPGARAILGTDYDWRKAEARLNAFPQFVTTIDGVDIHFIHVRSRHPHALPLIMTHGWPRSIIELLKTVGPLTDPTAYGGRAGTRSTSSCLRFPASAFPASRADRMGSPTASRASGQR